MAQENIKISQSNFCIAPLVGTFATVDTTNEDAYLRIKNDTGGTTGSYTFNPNIQQGTDIYLLEYVGPRNTTVMKDGMSFYTMESDLTSSCTIKKWVLNVSNSRLDLDYSFTKTSTSYDKYICRSGTVSKYYTNLSVTTVTGTGFLKLDSVSYIDIGTRLFLGPSSNGAYMNDFEEVEVISVSGTTVFISSDSGVPPFSYYNSGDPVTYAGNTYLLSNQGANGDITKGTLFTLDSTTGAVVDKHYSAIYSNVYAARHSIYYYNSIGIVKSSELLYVNLDDFETKKSSRLNNILPDKVNMATVYDIEFTSNSIFRLQDKKVVRDDTGMLVQINWSTYNYHEDSVFRFTDSISLYTDPIGVIGNQETITVYAVVRDQYGVGISGKTVTFDKVSGDPNGVWGDVNREAITDINGVAHITYTSGWYDQSTIDTAEENIVLKAHTNGSNILTGSIYVWAQIVIYLNAKFVFGSNNDPFGMPFIKQKYNYESSEDKFFQIGNFSSDFYIKSLACFQMPGGNVNCPISAGHVTILKQLRNFYSTVDIDQTLVESELNTKQIEVASDTVPVSQTYISRHYTSGNQDTVDIAQFKFIVDMIPAPYSEKNNVNTDIWVKMSPYGFDLNKTTLVFKVREVSYAGDSGFIDYVGTSYLNVVEFDAGGGLLGLEVLLQLPSYFHNNAIVYVYIEVYDNATPPNKIEFDYWFRIIADYNAPYILNEVPARNSINVDINTDITFDIVDNEVGVDIDSLELYVNNSSKWFVYTTISGGYHVEYYNNSSFYYEQPVEVSIKVNDSSEQSNVLYDMWRFTCISSIQPLVDPETIIPKVCSHGVNPRTTKVSFIVYDNGSGVDPNTIMLRVAGVSRPVLKKPVLQRIK